MTPPILLALLLALAVVVAWARLLLWQRRAAPEARAAGVRLALLLLAQPVCAALLYLTLLPPRVATGAGTLTVLTRNAGALAAAAGANVVALPEADAPLGAERVPDLGTALRRYPDVARIVVRGDGLPLRDRAAATDEAIDFAAGTAPRGLVRLDPVARAAPGTGFAVSGRIAGHDGGTVELLDPGGQGVAQQPLDGAGEFTLRGTARAAGVALFTLRVRDARRAVVERAAVPLVTADEPAPRILLLAGAPGPEPKFLRRWAADAGLALHAQYPTGGGIAIGDGALPVSSATLGRFDLAILDERSWAALGAGERAALIGAVRGGLGLVLRVTGPLPDATRRQWQALGFSVSGGGDVVAVKPAGQGASLSRRSVRIAGRDLLPLVRDGGGAALANWRAEGRGRVAVWPLTDSFVLALASSGASYGQLWSDALSVLARGRPTALPRLDSIARATQRVTLCGLAGTPAIDAPAGSPVRLVVEPPRGCAAFWPAQSGWHSLRVANAAPMPFYVHARDALPAQRAAEERYATTRLSGVAHGRAGAAASRPGRSWPWFLGWLAASGLLWWFERRRAPTLR